MFTIISSIVRRPECRRPRQRLGTGATRLGIVVVLAIAFAACGGSPEGGSRDRRDREPASVPGASFDRDGERPNIVLVMTDDQDAASLSVMPRVRHHLGRHGTRFSDFYASFPLCCPSRATMITGQYAHNHGVLANDPPRGGYQALTDRRHTLGVWLREAGYRTAWIGKYLNHYAADGNLEPPAGWSRWVVPVAGIYDFFDYRLDEDGELVEYRGPREYQTDVLAGKALSFLRARAGRRHPFFLVFSPIAPHSEADEIASPRRNPRPAPRHYGRFAGRELPSPPSFDEADVSDKPAAVREPRLGSASKRDLLASYRGRLESLLAVDEAVAELVATLRAKRELENTVLIFLSDNGLLLGEHRLAAQKGSPYEESARVPLLIRGPGFPAGATRRVPVANVDIVPTILDLAGARPTRRQDGRSLVGIAADPASGRRRAILLEGHRWVAVRAGRYVWIEHARGGRELYDLRRDPYQLRNLAEAPGLAGVRDRLSETLSRLRDCAAAACRIALPAARP